MKPYKRMGKLNTKLRQTKLLYSSPTSFSSQRIKRNRYYVDGKHKKPKPNTRHDLIVVKCASVAKGKH